MASKFRKLQTMALVIFAILIANFVNAQSKITFTTTKSIGEQIKLVIDAAPADRPDVWLDLNNNGIKDSGEAIIHFSSTPDNTTSYTIDAQNLTLHGKVTFFECRKNNLSSLDVSQNTQLTVLNCGNNGLSGLDVSNNTQLTELYCGNNGLSGLDVSNNTQLTELYCSNNGLSGLDVSNNTQLTTLYCGGNPIGSLDVSGNTQLMTLLCDANDLSSLDVSGNTQLTYLDCDANDLSSLDVSGNTQLTTLYCDGNALTSLNVANSNNSNITTMWAQNNPTLLCIEHDAGFAPTTNAGWEKDATASWSEDCNAMVVYIPDANFKAYLVGRSDINTNGDGEIQVSEAAAFTDTIDCGYKYIGDLTGIEAFTGITKLDCHANALSSLDVSGCAQLTTLSCEYNALSNLNVSNSTQLTYLSCGSNDLSSLDVSGCAQLTTLSCEYNALSSLDVSGNTQLMTLLCHANDLSSLDVSNNTQLTYLSCYWNNLSSLDVSACAQLTYLSCYWSNLSSLDVSACAQLDTLLCYGNALSGLNLANNKQLTTLDCSDNALGSLDVSIHTQLTELDCSYNGLSSLDVSNNTQLTRLDCGWNALTSLNVANGNDNGMSDMYAEYNPDLLCIQHDAGFDPDTKPCVTLDGWCKDATADWSDYCSDIVVYIPDVNFKSYLVVNTAINTNGDTEIQVSEAAVFMGTMDCSNKSISDLTGIEAFTAITELNCSGNHLSSLDVSECVQLTTLDCRSNNLGSLDVSGCAQLTTLRCSGNELSSLDVSECAQLTTLWCDGNDLGSLNVSNAMLTELICNGNDLSSLDVSTCEQLTYLECDGNDLSSLDVSGNTQLTYLKCKDNNLSSLNVANGNNSNMWIMHADGNPGLCIKHDIGFDPTTKPCASYAGWCKEATASWSDYCDAVVYIPDANFKAYLLGRSDINTDGDGEIQVYEAEAFTDTIDCGDKYIGDLTGIEAFTGLTKLECYHNYLESLDVSKNTKLIYLDCADNQLSSLDVSQNKDLKHLDFSQNSNIRSVDLSQNRDLFRLYCSSSSLSTLDVSQNTALRTLKCGHNNLNSLAVSENSFLEILDCSWNDLTNLDISQNLVLKELKCNKNELTELNFINLYILEKLDCSNNQLTRLNVANGNNSNMTQMHAQGNTNLTCIEHDEGFDPDTKPCATSGGWCKDATANWNGTGYSCTGPPPGSPYITLDVVSENSIKLGMRAEGLDVDVWIETSPGNYYLLTLGNYWMSGAIMAETNTIKVYGDVIDFSCGGNGADVTGVDISNNLGLKTFYCKNDSISNLDISDNTNLRLLDCTNTQLSSIDVSQNNNLSELYCNNNQLQTLDVSHTTMKILECKNNQLTVLNVTTGGNNEMTKMWAQDNPDLFCIQHDLGFNPDSKTCTATDGWCKDATANWNGTSYSCTSPPANSPYITLDVVNGSPIGLSMKANADKEVWIEVSTGDYYYREVGTDWSLREDYIATSGTIKVYGDITGFDCSQNGVNVTDLDISNNTALKELKCYENDLTILDISDNTVLDILSCGKNRLTDIYINQNTFLTELYCEENNIKGLDVSDNEFLRILHCYDNDMEGLDISGCSSLEELLCFKNKLPGLFLSQNPELLELSCWGNDLKSLNVDDNVSLKYLSCGDNDIEVLNLSQNVDLLHLLCYSNKLTSLDVSNNSSLTKLDCRDNLLSELKVSNGNNSNMYRMDAQGNPNLFCIQHDLGFDPGSKTCTTILGWCKDATAIWNGTGYSCTPPAGAKPMSLKVASGSTIEFSLFAGLLKTPVWVEVTPGVYDVFLLGANFWESKTYTIPPTPSAPERMVGFAPPAPTDVDLKIYGNVLGLNCNSNGTSISEVNTSSNPSLEILHCAGNTLGALNVSGNPDLKILDCRKTNLTSLDVSRNSELTNLNCKNNLLTSLNVANGNNVNMTKMIAEGNSELTCIQIDASFNPDTQPCSGDDGWCKESTAKWSSDCSSAWGIELLSFGAKSVDNEQVKLDWATATETDNDYFEVERSIDGVAWEVVAKIDGAGNSNSVLKYEAWDEEPYTGVSYYRLKQTDMDGAYSYSDAVAVSIVASKALKVYPNPAREILRIEIGKDIPESEQIRILNVAGKLVATKPAKSHMTKIDVSNFEAGVYFVKAGGEVRKVVVSD